MREEQEFRREERLPGEVVEIYRQPAPGEVVEQYVRPLPGRAAAPARPAAAGRRRRRGLWVFLICLAVHFAKVVRAQRLEQRSEPPAGEKAST